MARPLLQDLAGVWPKTLEEERAALPVLIDYAMDFLEVSSAVTLTEWCGLPDVERQALLMAVRRQADQEARAVDDALLSAAVEEAARGQ